MRKIFYLTTDSKIGGTEKMLLALLSRLDRDKYNTFICALKPGGPLIEEAEKIGVKGKCLGNPIKLALLIKKEKPDILHTFLFHANILGRILGRLCGVPVIISSQRSVDKWRKPWHILFDRWTSGFCNLIISNSEAGRKILIDREKINPEKIITIHNGVDVDKFERAPEGLVNISEKGREFGFGHDDTVIGIIANLRKVKGHCYLFEAVSRIKELESQKDIALRFIVQKIKVLVVGEGKLKQELTNLAEKLGIRDSVIFTGFQNNIPEILKMTDIFVLPSLWEGFPVSILEAMASAKPVIASRVGGIPEAVIDGETGLLVPPGDVQMLKDAIMKLIAEPEKAKKMGENGRKRIKEYFTLDKMIKKTEEVYDGFRRSF